MHKELRQRISKSMNSERCLQFTEETFLVSYFVEVNGAGDSCMLFYL